MNYGLSITLVAAYFALGVMIDFIAQRETYGGHLVFKVSLITVFWLPILLYALLAGLLRQAGQLILRTGMSLMRVGARIHDLGTYGQRAKIRPRLE